MPPTVAPEVIEFFLYLGISFIATSCDLLRIQFNSINFIVLVIILTTLLSLHCVVVFVLWGYTPQLCCCYCFFLGGVQGYGLSTLFYQTLWLIYEFVIFSNGQFPDSTEVYVNFCITPTHTHIHMYSRINRLINMQAAFVC